MGGTVQGVGNQALGMPSAGIIAQFQNILQQIAQQEKNQATPALQAQAFIQQFAGQDGKLNADELHKALGISTDQAAQMIKQLDEDGDPTTLSQAELSDALQQSANNQGPQGQQPNGNDPAGGGQQADGGQQGQQAGGGQQANGGQQAGGAQQAGGDNNLMQLLQALLDVDGNGKVDKKDLQKLIEKYGKGQPGHKTLDKAGLEAALKAEAKDKGLNLTDQQISAQADKIMAMAGNNGNGTISEDQVASLNDNQVQQLTDTQNA